MEDELWYLNHQSRVLRAFRHDIQPHWDDEAAREINLRYLNPHEDDNSHLLAGLESQALSLAQVADKVSSADAQAFRAEQLSQEIANRLQMTHNDVAETHQYYEQCREFNAVAVSLLPKIASLLAQANSVCTGVPES